MRFVWDVMNCYLDDTRSKRYLCKAKKIKTCTSMLPDSILQIYTQFMNHADDICFYQEFKVDFVDYPMLRSGSRRWRCQQTTYFRIPEQWGARCTSVGLLEM